jgi:DNA-binding transcriptional MerR regulator
MDQLSIGEFARQSRLSRKALRLYDDMGLLVPARVDASTGYRFYGVDQLERARLVADLRRLDLPLAEIMAILALSPEMAAQRIAHNWATAETEHAARRELARVIVNRLNGRRSVMYDVQTREIPRRSILCRKRNVAGESGAWAFGKECIGLLKDRPPARIEGPAGATFCIFWGEVTNDSDGPLEWCRPIPDEQAATLAAGYPEFSLRSEPAHKEAFIDFAPGGQTSPVQWQLVSESLEAWADEHHITPTDLGARITYRFATPLSKESVTSADFGVPYR